MILLGFLGPQEIFIILIAVLLFSVLPIIALIDIIRSEFTGSNKLIWVLIVLFTWLLGAILYFILGRSQKIK